jgi:hypothetical protein
MKGLQLVAAMLLGSGPVHTDPVGLGIYVSNGVYSKGMDASAPGQLHILDDGIPRFIQEFDIASKVPTTAAQGIEPLKTSGSFAGLDWSGLTQVPCHPDGTLDDWRYEIDDTHWMHSTCYRDAAWMSKFTTLSAWPVDANGEVVSSPLIGLAGFQNVPLVDDTWWEFRPVARVVQHNCRAQNDCSNPDSSAYAEALIQARVNLHPEKGTTIPSNAASLKLYITSGAHKVELATIPVYHDQPGQTPYGYGLKASLAVITPTPASGYFMPGDTIRFQVTYTDNAGHRFFPQGFLPAYGTALFDDPSAAGLRYLTYIDDPVLYWAHKNTQSDMAFTMAGPIDKMNKIGTTPLTIAQAFAPQIPEATVNPDGYNADVQIFPPTSLVFPCLFSLATPTPAPECFQPVTDIFTMTIPAEGQSGTWTAQVKARRVWESEPVQAAASVRFQVGQSTPTVFTPHMTGCLNCHKGASSITAASHGFLAPDGSNRINSDLPECLSCHTRGYKAWFENDAGFDDRMTFVHGLSRRFFKMGGKLSDVTFNP